MATKLDQSSPAESRQAKPTASPSLAPKLSIFGTKAGFFIPKNKLAGSLVIRGGSAKNETPTASKEENNKHVQRKTKWGPDLALRPAVCKSRALAYQTRVEQITKQLKSGALEMGKIEGSMSTAKGSDSDGADNLKENEQGKLELLELERREIIGELLRLNPGYKAPDDYEPLLKETKIPLPVKAHPGHNIIGVLIGPESNTQKRLQEETGAIIQVYGNKKINGEKSEIRHPDIDEAQAAYDDLHINVSADSYDKVDAAVALIELLLAPVSANSTATSTTATVSSAVTSDAVNPADMQLVQTTTSQPDLLHYQSHNAPWLSTPQTNGPSIPSSGPVSSSLPNNSSQLQTPVGSFSIPPYTGQPHHMNTMPRNPLPVPGPPPSVPNVQQPPPQFRANTSIGPPFGQSPGIVSPQPTPSSSVPPPVRSLQTPHASGGWPSFPPVMSQAQRPPQASPTFMPVRPLSVSPLGVPPQQGPIALMPPSNIPTNYRSQHPPVANFTPSATLLSWPPSGAQSFPSVSPQGPSSPFPAGTSAQSPYPLYMQVRPTMSTPDTMRGPPPLFSQVGPTPGMVPSSAGSSCPSASAPASSQASRATLRPPRPAVGDFTFQPVVSHSSTPDFPASASQMGMHANIHPGLPHAPFFHPANQNPNVPVQGFQRPLDRRPMGQSRMHAPPPHFPGAFPRNPSTLQAPAGFRMIPPALQPGGWISSPPMPPPSNVSSFLPSRPYQFMAPRQQNLFANTNRQGDNPGGANAVYDPFAPSAASGEKKTEEP